MFTDLNKSLQEIKERQWKKRKYEEHIARAKDYLRGMQSKVSVLSKQLEKEQADVAKLERVSLTNIFYTITGKKLEKMNKEQQEALSAQLKYEEALEVASELEEEIAELSQRLNKVINADTEYKELLKEKERLIQDQDSIWTEQLYELSEQQSELAAVVQEYNEAIDTGKQASKALAAAISSLESAKGWSTWDMFGGGMITTAIKHSRLDDAKSQVHIAQTKLRLFQEELADVTNHDKIELQFSGLLTFADYFFDGIIFDWMVHGKITDSLQQVKETKEKVDQLIARLNEQHKKRQHQLEETKIKRVELIESM
ncbi:hypothetical protein ACJ2A9_01180 [Anaerobacillus sp. MEB173]|uniref:hypothetical protein n=1 Tax=Anaerobacillus sp. MEB173 TaxID=3383345 RepID=UPI003F8E0F48